MANSDFISKCKNKILSEFQSNELLLEVLDTTEEEREELVYSRLFPFYYIPTTQEEVTSFICVEASINSVSRNGIFVFPKITIVVITHQDHQKLNMAGVSKTRCDYLAEIIDNMLNGTEGFGYGKLKLISNVAGSLTDVWRYRQLVFQSADINDSLCES